MTSNRLTRRELLRASGAASLAAALPFSLPAAQAQQSGAKKVSGAAAVSNPLKPPAEGSIPVAFLISEGAVIIDFCGPWEVFQDANLPTRKDALFNTYTVAETTKPIRASGGMQITPDYSYETAPVPKVL